MITRTNTRRASKQPNGLHSTGTITPSGKVSLRNIASRHGLTSKRVVINGEDPGEYAALRGDLLEEWNPATFQETQLVIEIAESSWRLQRARRVEVQLFESNMRDGLDPGAALAECFHANARQFDNLRRYTTTIELCRSRAVTALGKLRQERQKSAIGFVSQILGKCQ